MPCAWNTPAPHVVDSRLLRSVRTATVWSLAVGKRPFARTGRSAGELRSLAANYRSAPVRTQRLAPLVGYQVSVASLHLTVTADTVRCLRATLTLVSAIKILRMSSRVRKRLNLNTGSGAGRPWVLTRNTVLKHTSTS